MQIVKILNNNAVVTIMPDGKEALLRGASLGFNKKVGDLIDQGKIEKTYYEYDEHMAMYEALIRSTPELYFKLADEIIELAEARLSFKAGNPAVFALADHIHTALRRQQDNILAPNLILEEINLLYSEEFKLGRQALMIIQERTGNMLPNDEAGYIALHIVNARTNEPSEDVGQIILITNGILEVLKSVFQFQLQSENYSHTRLVLHLKLLAKRILKGENLPLLQTEEVYQAIIDKDPLYTVSIQDIDRFLQDNFDYTLSKEEKLYILIHIYTIFHSHIL